MFNLQFNWRCQCFSQFILLFVLFKSVLIKCSIILILSMLSFPLILIEDIFSVYTRSSQHYFINGMFSFFYFLHVRFCTLYILVGTLIWDLGKANWIFFWISLHSLDLLYWSLNSSYILNISRLLYNSLKISTLSYCHHIHKLILKASSKSVSGYKSFFGVHWLAIASFKIYMSSYWQSSNVLGIFLISWY